MTQQNINYGSAANDGTGDAFRVAFKKTDDNFNDLYNNQKYIQGEQLLNKAFCVNDEDDLYAHDSNLLIVKYGVKTLALCAYQCDKVTKNEYALTQHARLTIYNLHSNTLVQSIEVAKANTEYNGITLANTPVAKPRLHNLGTGYVRIYFSCGDNIYFRDLNLSNYSLGNVTVFKAKIRNSGNTGWDAAAVDITIANLDEHAFRTSGKHLPTAAPYTLMPHISGIDHIQQVGSNYYMSCEAYYANSGDYGVVFLMESANLTDWKIYPPVSVGDVNSDCRTSESSFQYINGKWNVISRANNYLYSSSDDGGLTWSSQVASGLINPNYGSKTSADYVNIQKGVSTYYPISFFAYNKDSTIYGVGRPTMALAYTLDMVNFVDIAIMEHYRTNHYPAIFYYNGLLYILFTTSRATNTDRDTLMLSVFNPYKLLNI